MTDEEIFNEFTSADPDLGPRMDIGKASPWLRNRLNAGASYAQSLIRNAAAAAGKMPPIHFDWIENDDINACVFPHRGKYFIGVNAGSVVYLHSLFSRMLSNPRVLLQVGDVSQEEEARVPPVSIRLGRGNLHASGFVPVIPKDLLAAVSDWSISPATIPLAEMGGAVATHSGPKRRVSPL